MKQNINTDFTKKVVIVKYKTTEEMESGLSKMVEKYRFLKYEVIYNTDEKVYVVIYEFMRRKATLN